jgi:hypothetical protein
MLAVAVAVVTWLAAAQVVLAAVAKEVAAQMELQILAVAVVNTE